MGTGIPYPFNGITETKTNANTALDCQSHCQSTPYCKLFNWNANSGNCFLRSDLPNGTNSFVDTPAAIVGAKDCNNFKIIWPEIFPPEPEILATTTTTVTITTTTTATTTATTATTATTTTSQITSATRAADMEIPQAPHNLTSKRYLKIR
jgi:hypothetical protein